MLIVLYKLKDEENIREILEIAKEMNIDVAIISRENININYDRLKEIKNFKIFHKFNDLVREHNDKKFVFIETYGNKYLHEVKLSKDWIYVFGAEDYGVPLHEIEKVKDKEILKIPMETYGSYNVVSTVVMTLYEIFIQQF